MAPHSGHPQRRRGAAGFNRAARAAPRSTTPAAAAFRRAGTGSSRIGAKAANTSPRKAWCWRTRAASDPPVDEAAAGAVDRFDRRGAGRVDGAQELERARKLAELHDDRGCGGHRTGPPYQERRKDESCGTQCHDRRASSTPALHGPGLSEGLRTAFPHHFPGRSVVRAGRVGRRRALRGGGGNRTRRRAAQVPGRQELRGVTACRQVVARGHSVRAAGVPRNHMLDM